MVERVARALCRARDIDPDAEMKIVYTAPGHVPSSMPEWIAFEDDARAAIAAMPCAGLVRVLPNGDVQPLCPNAPSGQKSGPSVDSGAGVCGDPRRPMPEFW